MKKFMKTTIVWLVVSAVIFCACSEEEDPPDYNMTGTYKFTNSGGECTWVFKADKSYQASGYGITGTKTGTWSSSGNDVTISYESGSISGKEVFTVKESGNQLTLTLKDGSVSNLLVSLGLAAKSVTLTKTGDGTTAKDTAVSFSSVTADGSATQTTTLLTLTFSQAITGLSADDITLSGVSVTKGTLSNSGSTYALPISGFTDGGSLSVAVAKTGYTISGSPKTVTIYYYNIPKEIEMVSIPAGTFMMGSPSSEPNRDSGETQHSVTLSSFKMSKYPVTQAQWVAVMGAGEDRTTTSSGKGDNYPVHYVSWYDALVFCNKLSIKEGLNPVYSVGGSTNPTDWGSVPTDSNDTWNAAVMDKSKNGYRLPTEAEWEYACRGSYTNKATETNTKPFGIGDGTKMVSGMANFDVRYPYDLNHSPAGHYEDSSATGYVGKTTEVGSYEANNYGLYDMHGNLCEWCWDRDGSYPSGSQTDPTGSVTGPYRGVRGGGWFSYAQNLRSAYRGYDYPNRRNYFTGFRLVRSF